MAIFFLLSLFFLLVAFSTVLIALFKSSNSDEAIEERREEKTSGHDRMIVTLFAMLRIGKRKVSQLRRFSLAYFLHLSVRVLRIFERISFFLYSKSRNMFIKNAVKHKGTVPFFWEYLKTYKQEIDREKKIVHKQRKDD